MNFHTDASVILCAISNCKNSLVATKTTDRNIVYHKFPKNRELKDAWVSRCDRDYLLNTRHTRLCSDHFSLDDYETIQVCGQTKKKLKRSAIPSLKLGPKWNVVEESTVTSTVMEENYKSEDVCEENELDVRNVDNSIEVVPLREFEILMNELENEKRENFSLRSQLDSVKEVLETKNNSITILRQEMNSLREKLQKKTTTHEKLIAALKSLFTENQIKLLTCEQKRVNWTDEDMSAALTLRFLGKRTYEYLRERRNYPLPSFSTLDRWASLARVKNKIDEAKQASLQIGDQLIKTKKRPKEVSEEKVVKSKKRKVVAKTVTVMEEAQFLPTEEYEDMYLIDTSTGENILIPICAIQNSEQLFTSFQEEETQTQDITL